MILRLEDVKQSNFFSIILTLFALIIPGLVYTWIINPVLFFNLNFLKLILLSFVYSMPLFFIFLVYVLIQWAYTTNSKFDQYNVLTETSFLSLAYFLGFLGLRIYLYEQLNFQNNFALVMYFAALLTIFMWLILSVLYWKYMYPKYINYYKKRKKRKKK